MTLAESESAILLDHDDIDTLDENLLKNSGSQSPVSDDLNPLHFQVKKLQKLLINEQDKYSKLQKQLQDSENQRLELISSSNREIFDVSTQFTKLRSDYEKNEAIRRSLEYDLTLCRNSLAKEKNITAEKDKLSDENTKMYQEQIKNLKKENLNLVTSLENCQEKVQKKEGECKKILLLNQEQENLIKSFKEESNLNREVNEKLKEEIQAFKDKLDKSYRHIEQLVRKNQNLDESLKKENEYYREIKLKFETEQKKNQELVQKLQESEDIKTETDINMEKLLDQLKENRKELLDEQTRAKDNKERFKIVEAEFKLANSDLTQRLEEKSATIKNLSDQLNMCEKELLSIKNELKQTTMRQVEFDKIYEVISKDIKKIIKVFGSLSTENDGLKQTLDKLKTEDKQACTQGQYMLKQFDNLYKVIQEYFNSMKKNPAKFNSEKLYKELQFNEKKLKEVESTNQRLRNDIELLRNERDAIEEVVQSLTNECDTLKLSLHNQYDLNDSLKNKINSMAKKIKENEDN